MTRNDVKVLASGVVAALASFAKDNQLTVRYAGGSFGPTSCSIKLEFSEQNGKPAGRDADTFSAVAALYGLKATDLGKKVQLDGTAYTIVGARSRASKNPIIMERSDGKRYCYQASIVRLLLDQAAQREADASARKA